jgi:hypothetical protein
MKTEHLVEALVADRAAGRKPISMALVLALALGGVMSLVLFLVDLGVRADIEPALATWRFDLKVGMVLVALVLAFGLCLECARPDPSGRPMRRLWPLAVLAIVAIAAELVIVPKATWGTRLVGSNSLVCLSAIPMLSIAPFAAVLAILRRGAPASPALAGAAAGLLAAASGAALYAFHCFDDSPLFVVTWYSLAAIPIVLMGALVGRRLLRW